MSRAVVIGASMAGLLAARVLADSHTEVIVLDRDDVAGTGPRKAVPHGRHTHGLLSRGIEILEELFPGLTADLTAQGAVPVDIHGDITWHFGLSPLVKSPSELTGLCLSRPALEDAVRARVRARPNVDIRSGVEVTGLRTDPGRTTVTGVDTVDGPIDADLVVDASGRGSRTPIWLGELGYEAPREDSVTVSIGYTTRYYARTGPLPSGALGLLSTLTPDMPCGSVILPMEVDRWALTLFGMGDDIPPTDPEGFAAYAHRIPLPDLLAVIDGAEPLTEPLRFRFPASQRRRYERLSRIPSGFLVVGDALCSFNPIYGQGMTVAATEVLALRECLRNPGADLPRRYYRQVTKVVDVPWDMAVGGDLSIPTVPGPRPMRTRVINAYIGRVWLAAQTDNDVALAFHRTLNLTRRPEKLFAPAVLRRALFARRRPAAATR